MPVLLALLSDLLFGDPPNRFHPTAWMGSLIAFLSHKRPHNQPTAELLSGGLLMLVGLAFVGGLGVLLAWSFTFLPLPLNWLLGEPAPAGCLPDHYFKRGM